MPNDNDITRVNIYSHNDIVSPEKIDQDIDNLISHLNNINKALKDVQSQIGAPTNPETTVPPPEAPILSTETGDFNWLQENYYLPDTTGEDYHVRVKIRGKLSAGTSLAYGGLTAVCAIVDLGQIEVSGIATVTSEGSAGGENKYSLSFPNTGGWTSGQFNAHFVYINNSKFYEIYKSEIPNGNYKIYFNAYADTLSGSVSFQIFPSAYSTNAKNLTATVLLSTVDIANGYVDFIWEGNEIALADSCYGLMVAIGASGGYSVTTYMPTDRPFIAGTLLPPPETPTITLLHRRRKHTKYKISWSRDWETPPTSPLDPYTACNNFYKYLEIWTREHLDNTDSPLTPGNTWEEEDEKNIRKIIKKKNPNKKSVKISITHTRLQDLDLAVRIVDTFGQKGGYALNTTGGTPSEDDSEDAPDDISSITLITNEVNDIAGTAGVETRQVVKVTMAGNSSNNKTAKVVIKDITTGRRKSQEIDFDIADQEGTPPDVHSVAYVEFKNKFKQGHSCQIKKAIVKGHGAYKELTSTTTFMAGNEDLPSAPLAPDITEIPNARTLRRKKFKIKINTSDETGDKYKKFRQMMVYLNDPRYSGGSPGSDTTWAFEDEKNIFDAVKNGKKEFKQVIHHEEQDTKDYMPFSMAINFKDKYDQSGAYGYFNTLGQAETFSCKFTYTRNRNIYTFTLYFYNGTASYNYNLDYGDGSTPANASTSSNPYTLASHAYPTTGSYEAVLTVTDSSDPSATADYSEWISPGGGTISQSQTEAPTAESGTTWTNLAKIEAEDGAFATATIAGDATNSNPLTAKTFGFAVADTIVGIKVRIKGKCNYSNSVSANVSLLNASGNPVGNWKTTGLFTNANTSYILGSETDKWGTALAASDINNSNFGVKITFDNLTLNSRTIYIDYVEITVYYYEAL